MQSVEKIPQLGGIKDASPRTRKADLTRRRIIDAAEQQFAESGFYGASLREITRSLGMPNATLLYHFPTKERLYAAVLDRIAQTLGGSLERVMAAP
ncbi:MAG: TetR/AcrR family transcriptional regulator, partial [Myxococcales bacterium]|nr:TetR/AcrR family transcriptional regulator [Myxococcales bacterium]